MIRCVMCAALFFCLCGCVADGFVITEVGADEVIKERKVERSVKVVPYVEPPPKEFLEVRASQRLPLRMTTHAAVVALAASASHSQSRLSALFIVGDASAWRLSWSGMDQAG